MSVARASVNGLDRVLLNEWRHAAAGTAPQLEVEKREKEAAQRAAATTASALEAEKKLAAAMR